MQWFSPCRTDRPDFPGLPAIVTCSQAMVLRRLSLNLDNVDLGRGSCSRIRII